MPSCSRGENRFYTPGSQLPSPEFPVDYLQDANWNTTAVVGFNGTTGTWGVTQRYVYSPYGSITVLNADWSTPPAGTQPVVNNLYQGMTLDAMTGLYYERFRNYSPTLGTWISQDPLQYINGANTYQFVMGNPVNAVDAAGLQDSNGQAADLPGPQPPVFDSAKAKKLPGGRVQITYKYTQDLGLAVAGVDGPPGSYVQTFLKSALRGVSKLTEIGEILKKMGDTLSQQAFQNQEWRGTAFPEVIKIFSCKHGKLHVVKTKVTTYANTLWAMSNNQHGSSALGVDLGKEQGEEADHSFIDRLNEVEKEFGKIARSEK